MSKIKKLIAKFIGILFESLKRFPEAIVISISFVIVMIIKNRVDTDPDDIYRNLGMILGLGIPIAVTLKLLVERLALNRIIRTMLDVALLAYILLFLKWIPEVFNDQFIFRYMAATSMAYILFTLIPYAFSSKGYGKYLIKVITAFLITYLYTLVLYFGTIAIIFAIDQLFAVEIAEEIYFDLFIASVGVFGLTYYLGKVPRMEDDLTTYNYPTILRVLFASIVIPLISVYTAVLLAYFVNIAFVQVWPKGIIAMLVLWYGFVSIILLMVIEPIKDHNKLVKYFRQYYPIAMLIPLGMLLASLIIRINDYGLTVNRMLIIVAWVWFILIDLYLIFFKTRCHQWISVIFLAIVLMAFFGPINVFNMTVSNQLNNLNDQLKEHQMLVNGEIIAKDELEETDEMTIGSQLKLLEEYNALDRVEGLPDGFVQEDMEEVFGFTYKGAYYYREFGQTYVSYHSRLSHTVDISSYNYHLSFNVYDDLEEDEVMSELDIVKLLDENDVELSYSYQEDTEPIYLKTMYDGHEALVIIESVEGQIINDVLNLNRVEGHLYY